MTQIPLDDFILENKIIGFFDDPITLKSGRQSHFYVNWRKATNDAYLLDQTTDYLIDFLRTAPFSWNSLYGVPEGATKLAVIASFKWAKAALDFSKDNYIIPMGRAKPKPHGQPADKFFIGQPKGKTVVIEDTATTGLSLLKTLDELLEQGIDVVAAITLTDRMEKRDDGQSVAEEVASRYQGKIQYHTLSQATNLLPKAAQLTPPSPKAQAALTKEFEQYGSRKLDWSLT